MLGRWVYGQQLARDGRNQIASRDVDGHVPLCVRADCFLGIVTDADWLAISPLPEQHTTVAFGNRSSRQAVGRLDGDRHLVQGRARRQLVDMDGWCSRGCRYTAHKRDRRRDLDTVDRPDPVQLIKADAAVTSEAEEVALNQALGRREIARGSGWPDQDVICPAPVRIDI